MAAKKSDPSVDERSVARSSDVGPSAEKIKKRLTNKALHYLGRYASTSAQLEVVLRKFVKRKLELADPALLDSSIRDVIESCIRLGYIDDAAFIRSQFRQGLRSGHSQRRILLKLAQKGISRDLALSVLQDSDDDALPDDKTELAAALIYARKKSIGPFASTPPSCPEVKKKHMGRLARNGFSFDVVRKVMALASAEDADTLLDEVYPHR